MLCLRLSCYDSMQTQGECVSIHSLSEIAVAARVQPRCRCSSYTTVAELQMHAEATDAQRCSVCLMNALLRQQRVCAVVD